MESVFALNVMIMHNLIYINPPSYWKSDRCIPMMLIYARVFFCGSADIICSGKLHRGADIVPQIFFAARGVLVFFQYNCGIFSHVTRLDQLRAN